ncbi:hypothetical protein L3X38_018937 [Prunus dulcis]|uniref:Uncharacterized protein n=1 Tax=Prunus dulcis TaxID=3755 RepID=A0AAD4W9X9_PRUDU|nr:hypothetical protein L3X38_018937 [Prunus dulcis]
MGVIQKEGKIFIDQEKYAKTLLDRFGLKDCKLVSIPLVPIEKLKREYESELADEETYRKIVGSLLYLTATRPDIMYLASLLARFMHGPSKKHFGAARRVLRWYKELWIFRIEYVSGKSVVLIGFCDSLSETKQCCVVNYIAEYISAAAEYVSAAEATTQAIWLRFVLGDFGEEQLEVTPIMCDNTSAIAMSKNPVFHQRHLHEGITKGKLLHLKSANHLEGSVDV